MASLLTGFLTHFRKVLHIVSSEMLCAGRQVRSMSLSPKLL